MKPAVASTSPRSRNSGARSIFAMRQAVLLRAARTKDLDIVQVLIDAGADVNCTDSLGLTPLHLACRENALDVCFVLLEAGADVQASSRDGQTPLHLALASCASESLVALLLARGANPRAPDFAGVSPAELARVRGLAL